MIEYYKDGTPCECDRMYRDCYDPGDATTENAILMEWPVVNGKMHGIRRQYDTNGNIEWEDSYIAGRPNGFDKWFWPSGILSSLSFRVNGKIEGLETSYYENGTLHSEVFYKKGKREGAEKWFFTDGAIERIDVYKEGKFILRTIGGPTENAL
jgi:antitoxin component YwqK of YwqJK toxin-antitoxin module